MTCDLIAARGGTGNIMARVVPAKGVSEYAVQVLSNELTYLGHREVILKSDGKPSIVALKGQPRQRERSASCWRSRPYRNLGQMELPKMQ